MPRGSREPTLRSSSPFLNASCLVILSERAARARAKDLEKQILRACGAQDDRLARFAKQKREQKSLRLSPSPKGAARRRRASCKDARPGVSLATSPFTDAAASPGAARPQG